MKYRYSIFVFSIVLLSGLNSANIVAQNINPLVHAMRFKTSDTTKTRILLNGAQEDASQRTLYSSMWRTKNGKVIARYTSYMINYPDANGNLQPIDLNLHKDSKGWVADKQPNPCYFYSDKSTVITIGKGMEITYNKNCTINDMPLEQTIMSIKDNDVKINLPQGIHKDINFITGGIETNYIFDSPLEGGITVKEEVEYPEGCTIQRDLIRGDAQPDGGWAGDYLLLAPDGKKVLAQLKAAECYDAKKNWCFASYSLQKINGKNILVTTVPSNWLLTAVFPVTLDPRFITTSAWNGGSSVSCIYPNFHTDSIQVTIPGKVTVTDFKIYYAYVSSKTLAHTIPTSYGIFYLSTPCSSTDTSSCASSLPSHGDTAGVCWLDTIYNFAASPFNFTCCYPPSCSPQTFWLDAHLSRRSGGLGCDSTTIWYERDSYTGIRYYFSAWLEGYTDSTAHLSYTPAAQCSNICTINMNASLEFGVPPYTVSHPWASRDTVVGSYGNLTCVSQGNVSMKLKVPGCPYTCGNVKTIKIPPPTVTDFCGNVATPLDSVLYTINPVPVVTLGAADTVVCSGLPVKLSLQSCLAGTKYTWGGTDNASGTSDSTLIDNSHDTGNVPMVVTYTITGSVNGCNSDTIKTTAVINPYPIVTVTGQDTVILGNSVKLVATGGGKYSWTPTTGLSCTTCPNPTASPTITTKYSVTVTDSGGCDAIVPFTLVVLDQNIVIPNVITPNGDDINDYFVIKNLQDYPNSKLTIFDRWGKQVYTTNNYQNNWNGGGQSAGVYYYVLVLPSGKKYDGFVQIIK